MKTLLLFLTLSVLVLFSACSDSPTQNVSEDVNTDQTETKTAPHDTEVAKDLEDLNLNDGEKWKADSSTHKGMNTVQQMLTDFQGDTKQLGKDVKDSLNAVIKACDFKGKDHDQYHIILHAMLKEAKKLKKGKTNDLSKMQAYVDAYYEHFEVGDIE
ncbi:MAG: hypothetical protein WDZ35_04865 [Crocinitomicaceae bacterium]